MLAEVLEVAILLLGLAFCLLAGVGIVRMPDIFTRMQASTKAGTLGIACIIAAVAIHFGDAITALQAGLVIAFLFLTAPIASHLIARSVHFYGVYGWDANALDEMTDMRIINAARPPAPPRGDRPVDDTPGVGGGHKPGAPGGRTPEGQA
jgi:multicomponent Na+:H+ antiporter subunit G